MSVVYRWWAPPEKSGSLGGLGTQDVKSNCYEPFPKSLGPLPGSCPLTLYPHI
ncbi:rCG61080 [Rattus norvegicus]|uniref:RCG61080 n=1 Tax=Rattus norvegicus TaxID=10116 RepID=A6JJS8_RAT|nr:rCG61080 [Rattus norvegicus]